jgi:hypothetical protein
MKKILILILAAMTFMACGVQKGKRITKEEYGDTWAFTVNEGYIYSINDAAIFKTGETEYALNGVAMSRGYKELKPIWKPHPKHEWMNVDVGPFIKLALSHPE